MYVHVVILFRFEIVYYYYIIIIIIIVSLSLFTSLSLSLHFSLSLISISPHLSSSSIVNFRHPKHHHHGTTSLAAKQWGCPSPAGWRFWSPPGAQRGSAILSIRQRHRILFFLLPCISSAKCTDRIFLTPLPNEHQHARPHATRHSEPDAHHQPSPPGWLAS
jgi:hypothetical protein